VLLATACLAGCGGSGGGVFAGADWGKPNRTDAAFVRVMLAHERAVGTIAGLGRRKALRQELRRIARATLARHDRHVRDLDWFDADLRTRPVSPGAARIRSGPPPFDPRGLRTAVSLDHDFLVLMIQQHEYAMATAAAERDHGGDKRLKVLAQAIYASSQEDLRELRRWLRTWYGDDTQPPPLPPPGGGGGGGGGPSPGPPV